VLKEEIVLRKSGEEKRNGAPGRSRTSDLLVRSQLLYPAELRAHIAWGCNPLRILEFAAQSKQPPEANMGSRLYRKDIRMNERTKSHLSQAP
jgi:hypothetical protein